LDQRAADAALAEIDGERQPDRPSPDDENLCIHSYPLYTMALRRASEPEERYGVAGADLCLVRGRYVERRDRRHLRADVMRAALRAERSIGRIQHVVHAVEIEAANQSDAAPAQRRVAVEIFEAVEQGLAQ